MTSSVRKSGYIAFIYFLVILGLLPVLAMPFISSLMTRLMNREMGKERVQCLSNLRQLATAVQMYVQDNNGRFPGCPNAAAASDANWTTQLNQYVSSNKMFSCLSHADDGIEHPVSYGYSALLVRPDGTGINKAQVMAPDEVGVLCDAYPVKLMGQGGLIGGGALADPTRNNVQPRARHSGGIIIAYADGHAEGIIPQDVNDKDPSNPITKAFYTAAAIGLVDNPAGGVSDLLCSTRKRSAIAIGGEFCTRPLLTAAAKNWAQKTGTPIARAVFLGQYNTTQRPKACVWGVADGSTPAHGIPIARDAVAVIVAKGTKITLTRVPQEHGRESSYVVSRRNLQTIFGATTNTKSSSCCPYTFDTNSGTRRYFTKYLETHISTKAFTVHNDWEMVDKVANDPYGIGYCSAAFVDYDRVTVLGIQDDTGNHFFPNWNGGTRNRWPLMRTLYAVPSHPSQRKMVEVMFTAGGWLALRDGPLYKASYFPPH